MKNYFKVAAKLLIKNAATSHNTTPRIIILLFRHADKAQQGSNLRSFANLLQMCIHQPSSIASLLDGSQELAIKHADLNQRQLDQYFFLYHCIDNFYVRGVQTFAGLSLYPRIEDLFPKVPIIPQSEPKPEPLADDFETLQQIGFVGTLQKIIVWNKQQVEALNLIYAWLRTPKADRQQIFRLFGYAGTGKTELSKTIADFVMNEMGKSNVPTGGLLFAAYTGKACSVLRIKGCRGADTLHSMLYKPVIDPDTGICKEFVLNMESPISQCALLIIDECSMVNDEMAKDILGFGTLILVLGDPAQLPPVKGEGYFTDAKPDYMMTGIERQAADNPIIYLATRVRKGKELKVGKYGESRVYDAGRHVSDKLYVDHDQIICGLNATRKTVNNRARRINGKADRNPIYPVAGDKLMCLKNNKTSGLYNGTLWTSARPQIQKVMKPIFKGSNLMRPGDVDVLAFKVRSLDEMDPQGNPYIIKTQCSLHHFNDAIAEPEYRDIAGTDSWTYGYGITAHKSQGSQWDSVLLFEESSSFREHRFRHSYTAITRAAERITILL